jgi:norsolorinic acid ketoreductase
VIATTRLSNTSDLFSALETAPSSTLIVLPLSSTSDTDAQTLHSTLTSYPNSLSHIDVVIANAGYGSSFLSTLATPLQALRDDFEVNTLGPLKLFQALCPLLKEGKGKFVVISSSLGSIGGMELAAPCLSYGVSKAGVNYLVRKVHFEFPDITSFALHPG